MAGRIVFLDWIYEVGSQNVFGQQGKSELQKEIIARVREAVNSLPVNERDFISMYWFEGRSIRELSELLGKKPHKLDGMNRRIIRKLKLKLAEYVSERFGVVEKEQTSCIICAHPERDEIDGILLAKKPDQTFRPIYKLLSEQFGLKISTPQVLIGHMKYHINSEDSNAG
jgi:hypothetical protein